MYVLPPASKFGEDGGVRTFPEILLGIHADDPFVSVWGQNSLYMWEFGEETILFSLETLYSGPYPIPESHPLSVTRGL